jgi:hypothetical protein
MKILILTLGAAGLLGAQTFPAVHKKDLWRDVAGEVRITDSAIEFQAAKEKHSRRWKYVDIQHFDRLNEREFVVMSYEDERKYLGRDRRFHLSLTEGAISDELFESIAKRIGKPVTDRVIGDASAGGYVVPVKHLHGFGGCEGELWILDDRIIYSPGPMQLDKPNARLAETLWQTLAPRSQRRLKDVLADSRGVTWEVVVERARQSGRRIGMFLTGDFGHAARSVVLELGGDVHDLERPGGLAKLCHKLPALADLYRLAVRPEYADARWHQPTPASLRLSTGRLSKV